MRPARTPPSTFLFLPIQLSNSKAAKRPDNRSGQRPKRETRKGLKTRKNPPQPGQAQKARLRQVRRTPRKFRKNESPEKRNPRPPQSAAPLPMETIYGPFIQHVNRRKVAKASTNRLSGARSVTPSRPSGRGAGSLPLLSPLSPGAPNSQGDRRSAGPGAVRPVSREEKHTT